VNDKTANPKNPSPEPSPRKAGARGLEKLTMLPSSTRREFLRLLGAAGVVSLGAMPPRFLTRAAETSAGVAARDKRVLVMIQLAGGNDGLNTLVPFGDPEYEKARPGIGVPKGQVLMLNDHVGLHPNLTGLRELYDEGKLAILQGVGYPNPDRSHFRSMDIWQSAQPQIETPRDGWLGRALEWQFERQPALAEALTIGTDKLPLAFASTRVNVPTLRRLDEFHLVDGQGSAANRELTRTAMKRLANDPASASGELDFLRRATTTALTSAERLKSLSSTYRTTVNYPSTGLASRLKLIAQMLTADLPARMFFVSLDGFDTHSQQQPGHAALMAELSGAIRAFEQDLVEHKLSDRVVLATFSEFGRRVAENGSLGTDHGAASMLFALTPTGRAGLHGTHPSLTDLTDGDLKFNLDFRSVYATLLDKWLEIPSEGVLGGKFESIGFV
jgi:uncharacterized protein (DUF1501 family)